MFRNLLSSWINGDTNSKEHARRKEILQSIDERESTIWVYKQYILQEEAKLNRLHLELFSQSTVIPRYNEPYVPDDQVFVIKKFVNAIPKNSV